MKIKYRKLKCKYSGEDSHQFWKTINASKKKHGELYSLGCVLQNLEDFVLKRINEERHYTKSKTKRSS